MKSSMWGAQVNSLLGIEAKQPDFLKKESPKVPIEEKSLFTVKNRTPAQEAVFRKNAEQAYKKQMERKARNKQRLVDLMAQTGFMTAKELAQEIGLREHYICRLLWEMEDLLEYQVRKIKGHHTRYWGIK